jgi:hypothetical protein
MKRGIFNRYVDYICSETGVSRDLLFKKDRSSKYSTARFLLYAVCYQRPMTIVQIVDLMADNGYNIARQGVEYGIEKIQSSPDSDVKSFIKDAINNA